jgi:hypothetical protein
MKFFFYYLIILFLFVCCQNSVEEIASKYCECLEENISLPYEEQILKCDTIIYNLYELNDSQEDISIKNVQLDAILQNNCEHYNLLIENIDLSELKENILNTSLGINIESRLTTSEGLEFRTTQDFYYFEANGDTTHLIIKDDIWNDHFNKNQYESFLKIKWKSNCEFQLEMLHTTEPNRKVLYKKGDVFNYKIINRKENYYNVLVYTNEIKQNLRLYIK